MKRKTFLTLNAVIVLAVGCFALAAPGTLIASVKHAAPSDSANVMARTVGIVLIAIGVLNFLVRDHQDSPTLRAVLIANLVLQVGILPIDPIAYASGVFHTFGSFVPNTLLHVVLGFGFCYYLVELTRASALGAAQSRNGRG